jgi:hypothetical protein
MHLNEFADPKTYALNDLASVLKQLESIWRGPGLENCNLRILRPIEIEDRRRNFMDEWRRNGTNRQSRRRHLSPRRSQ